MNAPVLLDLARRATWPPEVAARLERFERLPSYGLHPDRCPADSARRALAAFGARGMALWHRHRSRALRAEQPLLARALPTTLPAALLRLVLLEPAALSGVAYAGGVTLLAPGIGATIARDAVAALRHALGEPWYQFAIHAAAARRPEWAAGRAGDAGSDAVMDADGDAAAPLDHSVEGSGRHAAGITQSAADGGRNATARALRLAARVAPLGWSVIDAALGDADPGVRARFALKRAPVPDPVARIAAVPPVVSFPVPTAHEALTLIDALIAHCEPAWFSSCNAIR